ncbi:hypothetical protein ACNJC6_01204 [Acinetobacter johnsonii]|uniref:Uncharacterized protein n=1 Tax=Acinetobacter johnsonii TaxID=40214 RepID=A0A1R7QBD0_ACIJO|nr:hypothetical protein ACNJC6_01204 [Acinetobacter johnsonii]
MHYNSAIMNLYFSLKTFIRAKKNQLLKEVGFFRQNLWEN